MHLHRFRRLLLCAGTFVPGLAASPLAGAIPATAQAAAPVQHPTVGSVLVPPDVDYDRPIYRTEFNAPRDLADWVLEGGRSARIEDGKLILESKAGAEPAASSKDFKVVSEANRDHLVYWLKREVPADFLCEVLLRPQNKQMGLNIIFFSTRGLKGESVLDPALAPRDGTFKQYHTGDLDGYHVSYWAAPRGTTHLRKNRGFHIVAVSDLNPIAEAPAEAFDTLRIYKRGAMIRVMVNDRVIVAWDDDGKSFGPAILHPGWIGLRQMGYTLRTEYDRLTIYPLQKTRQGSDRDGARPSSIGKHL